MEAMHYTARIAIERNMTRTTAFSARPDAPVQPIREPRVRGALGIARRALGSRAVRTARPATVACT